MVNTFRVMQVIVLLMTCPMIALGVMASLSGGGNTPAFQEIGRRLTSISFFMPILLLVVSELVHRWLKLTWVAIALLVVPVVVWGWLLLWLQRETGFFTP